MKKFLTLLMVCVLALMTGCGSGEKKSAEGQIKLGMITHLNVSETLLDNYFEKASSRMQQTSGMYAPKHIFFDNMTSMVAALKSKQIDALSTYYSVSNYLIAQNDDFVPVNHGIPKVSDSFCCALLKENVALQKEFDTAIDELRTEGTLKKLTGTYITNADENLPPVAMPNFNDAETVKVAVTGDLPPLDLVLPDGRPSGFNTALLAEIASKLGKNFELVKIDSGARAVALTSKQVDVVFWVAVPQNETLAPPDCDIPEGVILTVPYFTDEIVHVKLKK
ncbi:MAG: transporter substrate-binding domain-containing protein [Quinella sp. 2Q5]|nr:transporter substrate-binding domain-containing protein [Quinella sp. 2Q5]